MGQLCDTEAVRMVRGLIEMFIKIVTSIAFETVKDYEAEQKFKRENDLTDWKKIETTECTVYQKTDRYFMTEEVQ